MDDEILFCSDCKYRTRVVLDYASGDTICTGCGLVLDDHYIDETSEWRTFADSEKDDHDPNRVGNASNPLLSAGNLNTIIKETSKTSNNQSLPTKLNVHDQLTNHDKVLTKGFEIVALMADRLGIDKSTKIRADELYRKVVEKKSCRGKNVNAVLAACLFISCKESKLPRMVNEICSAVEGVTKGELNRAAVFVKEYGAVEAPTVVLNGAGYARRFCSRLGMANKDMKAVEEAYENAKRLDIRRTPNSILAAIIYVVGQLLEKKLPLTDIAMTVKVAEQTIRKSYKDIHPHVSSLIPEWYAKEEQLSKLCKPKNV